MIEIYRYQAKDGAEPFTEWLQGLRDKRAQAKVYMRLKRLEERTIQGHHGRQGILGGLEAKES